MFEWMIAHFAERLDRDIKDIKSKLFSPLVFWIMRMFEMMFNRNLFTNVEKIEIVVYFQLWGLFADLIVFPFRISWLGSKIYCKVSRLLKRVFKIIGKKDPEATEDEVRYFSPISPIDFFQSHKIL